MRKCRITLNSITGEFMKKLLLSLLMCACMLAPTSNKAHATDMAALLCKDVLAYPADQGGMVVIWIDGYLSSQSDNSVLSNEWIAALGTHIGQYCAANPTAPVMDALDSLPETEVSGGFDMLALPCEQFLASPADITNGIFWIDGYMSAASENTSMDDAWVKKLGTHLTTYCAANKTKTISDAMSAME